MNLYESFAQATQLGDLHTCLMMDMKACQEDDVRLLCYLTPSIYTEVRPPPGTRSSTQGIPSPSRGQVRHWAGFLLSFRPVTLQQRSRKAQKKFYRAEHNAVSIHPPAQLRGGQRAAVEVDVQLSPYLLTAPLKPDAPRGW